MIDNKDSKVIDEFGIEWKKFNYSNLDKNILFQNFLQYFKIFPWEKIGSNSIGFDMGCGSGRWAQFVAPKVKHLNCIDPSQALEVAKLNLEKFKNISFLNETTQNCSLEGESQDFGYCLGVLHHIPNTDEAIKDCSRILKKGAPFLIYVYYDFENKPLWFRIIWKISDFIRSLISKLPTNVKKLICDFIAFTIYFPLSRFANFLSKQNINVENIPLSDYKNKPIYQLRNDALDRFGTRLEKRFSKSKIKHLLEKNNFNKISFSDEMPYWCCLAYKK